MRKNHEKRVVDSKKKGKRTGRKEDGKVMDIEAIAMQGKKGMD